MAEYVLLSSATGPLTNASTLRYGFLMAGGLATPTSTHIRSVTPSPNTNRSESPTLIKAKSASHLSTMKTFSTPPRGRANFDNDADYPNTIPDPRTPSPNPQSTSPAEDPQHQHPDLSNEVAMLSTKLINAINYQTNLDDSLQHTRHELEAARQRIAQLEEETQNHKSLVSSGALVNKADLETLRQDLAESQKQRDTAEKGRKEMEVELETLTSALFEEANTMVAAARKDTEAVERRNAQLRTQLNDTELLLASQQEQLQDLKSVMEKMNEDRDRDETETLPRSSTAPSTPGVDSTKMSTMFDSLPFSPNATNFGDIAPDQPLRFSHLIIPVMRNDVVAYVDFADLLKSAKPAASNHSRNSSGISSSVFISSASSSSPNIPGSFSSGAAASPRDTSFQASVPPLKDSKFYKRCLVEDVEPTLRLDLAPGLSWLARRTVIGAVTGGTLVVEPFIPQSRFYGNAYACALCGESRRTEAHARRHRFRTSEDESAQRYPLCEFCLGRVRATGDFLGFLRMVRDGLWRASTEEDIKAAWEESVRLREKMFWARLGGGVVPAIGREPSPTGTQRRTDARSLRRNSTESSVPRFSRDSESGVESVHSKALEVPKLGEPRPPTRNNSRSTPTVSDGSTTSLNTSESSDTRDFADAQTDLDNIANTPTGLNIQEDTANEADNATSRTPRLVQEDGAKDGLGIEMTLPAAEVHKDHTVDTTSGKEDQAPEPEREKEEGDPVEKPMQPEIPGSFD
ncbi:hypothetical protein E4T38_06718 [Aureobasidium subglaciale]|nr:hypothetical protein E4T38_06718 [Aureobasidium subglaciale]KAI5222481.1 hypothetical protein E4T41_06569 [Aureobasidium subglaciale]KAI5223347.1 hypothetical protein E4T40_04485 [Aureobasidium subglaciale]KAI5259943.1 hypothetical protein E4T46_06456 [Aureobasidium subglaciale]